MSSQPYRIGIIDYSHPDWQGGRNYLRNLVAALRMWRDAPVPFEVIEIPEPPVVRHSIVGRVRNRVLALQGIHQADIHRELKKHHVDFAYYCATGVASKVGYRSAHWIADFQSLVRPEFSPEGYRLDSRRYFEGVLRDSQHVVLSSRASQVDCEAVFPRYVSKTLVIPFRVATLIEITRTPPESLSDLRKRYDLPERFFVVCNQFWAHKNHELVFRAVESLIGQGQPVCVVCTGQPKDLRDPQHQRRIDELIANPRVREGIRLVGKIPFSDLFSLIRHAQGVIQPSYFEGWNTSVEESHCLGKRILLSDIPVHREQACPMASYFAPTDEKSLAIEIQRLLNLPQPIAWDSKFEQRAASAYSEKVAEFARTFWRLAFGKDC